MKRLLLLFSLIFVLTAIISQVKGQCVTEVTLQTSTDPAGPWIPVTGDLVTGYDMECMSTTAEFNYLDVDALTSAPGLAVGVPNPFYLTGTYPPEFFAYWAAKGVNGIDNAGGWELDMWDIINGDEPMFFLYYDGSDYLLWDGLQFLASGGTVTNVLRISGDYPPDMYHFSGTITDATTATCTVSIDMTISDGEVTTVVCKNITVELDENGEATIVASDVDGGSADKCGTVTLTIDVTQFDCEDVGENPVILTVTDEKGNLASCTATVTVVDLILPVAVCQDVTVQLDADGNGSTTAEAVNNASADNCGIATMTLSQTDFDCGDVGPNVVILTVTDVNSNESTCTATVTVEDKVPPVAVCQDVTVQLDADGNGSTTAAAVNNASTDNCGIATMTLSQTDFDCGDVGPNVVTLIITDVNSNESTCTATVTVEDNVPPVPVCQNITVMLKQDGTVTITAEQVDGGSSDACGIESLAIDEDEFDCDEVGPNNVILTVTDVNNNTATCTAVVTVTERLTTLTYNGDLKGQYSDPVTLSATLIDDESGEGIEGKNITFTIGTQTVTVVTDEGGLATTTLILAQDPCEEYNVSAEFAHDCPYLASSDTETFDITPEDVEVEYVGVLFQATPCATCETATVKLMATIKEVDDGYPGDISLAVVSFSDRNTSPTTTIAECIEVDYFVDPTDPTTGIVTYDWPVTNITAGNPLVAWLGITVGLDCESCYFAHNNTNHSIITVYQPQGDFITGGGYIMPENAGGTWASDPDTKVNFGFNVKYTKKGNKLQGKMTIIFRKDDRVYQIKSNAITSLATSVIGPTADIGVFTSKADLKDVTDELAPELIDGNLILKVTITDKGEPGIADAIGITLWSAVKPGEVWIADELLYSCNWTGMNTVEETLVGGNLVVHTVTNLNVTAPTEGSGGKLKSATIPASSVTVYPNPFADRLYFDIYGQEEGRGILDIFDATGRKIETLFDQQVETGMQYHIEYKPQAIKSNMLFYRLIIGDQVFNGKVLYRE